MRQRSLTNRIFTAVFGLWFSLLVAEPMRIHACPMHDGPMAQPIAQQAVAATAVAPDMSGHAAEHHALQSHVAPAADHPADHGNHQCQCLGCCAGTSALAIPAAPDVNLQAPLATVQALRTPTGAVRHTAPRFAFAQPFANGPPARVAAMS